MTQSRTDPPLTIGEALARARALPTVEPLTAQVLLAHLTGQDRAWVLAHPEAALTEAQDAEYLALLARAAQGEPLAYLTGQREFYGLVFEVTPDVLIPRPETEELIAAVLEWARFPRPSPPAPLPHASLGRGEITPRIADVGTGSGIIAVTLAVRLPGARIAALDASPQALAVARRNAARHQVADRIAFAQSDLLDAVAGPFDVIAANLPYVASGDLDSLDVARWEPRQALDGCPDGLDAIRAMLSQAPSRLAPGGAVFLEIGYDQGERAAALCRDAFPGGAVQIRPDLAGLDRVVIART